MQRKGVVRLLVVHEGVSMCKLVWRELDGGRAETDHAGGQRPPSEDAGREEKCRAPRAREGVVSFVNATERPLSTVLLDGTCVCNSQYDAVPMCTFKPKVPSQQVSPSRDLPFSRKKAASSAVAPALKVGICMDSELYEDPPHRGPGASPFLVA